MLLSAAEQSNILFKQQECYRILNFDSIDLKNGRIFLSKKHLGLSYNGFLLLKPHLDFSFFEFNSLFTLKEVRQFSRICKEPFFISLQKNQQIYLADPAIKALIALSDGDKTIIF